MILTDVSDCRSSLGADGLRMAMNGVLGVVFNERAGIGSTQDSRMAAQRLCMWGFVERTALANAVKALEDSGERERAAASALFHNDMQLAAGALSGDDTERGMVALALAGHTATGDLWRRLCQQQAARETHPYLRAALTFVSGSGDGYFRGILNDRTLAVSDRVAFACRYLPDAELRKFLEGLRDSLVADGSLSGLLLTGMGVGGSLLMSTYVDRIGDVQTAALLWANETISDKRGLRWITAYRDLLDTWSLWEQRAMFDVARTSSAAAKPAQIQPRCTFCNAALAHNTPVTMGRGRPGATRSRGARLAACGSCQRPLPRCAVCLLPLGSPLNADPSPSLPLRNESTWRNHAGTFDCWFVWCQHCKHGGHAAHIEKWFIDHDTCPVAECTCHCAALDAN